MAQTSMKFLIALAISGSLIMLSQANEFLKEPTGSATLSEQVSEEDIRVSLLDEVEKSLGASSVLGRLSQMETTLRPIVAALPKNRYGNLEHPAVSYALHRLFVLRHGWVIHGLGPDAVAQNLSSPTGVLTDHVPAFIEGMFESRLKGKGFGLHETAVMAATIEHLIHNEAVARLGLVFNVHKLSVMDTISEADAIFVLDTYMMSYIVGEDLNNMTTKKSKEIIQSMPQVFLAWEETRKFVDGLRKKIIKDAAITFASLGEVVEAVGEQYGTFQDSECRQMKDAMVKMEYHGTGRVRLSDFYRPALEGVWTFQESSSYLRSLGLLDESVPDHPSVMLANYITSKSNCIASSGFYSVCCKNECEGLLGHLEESIGAPEEKPQIVAAIVSNVPSSSVTKLSASLLQRLDDIARGHGGKVPIHGRLFAQWLHHLYPRECPYPHMSGHFLDQRPDEFLDMTGEDSAATEEEMKGHVAQAATATEVHVKGDLAVEDLTPWSDQEEIIVALQPTASKSASIHSIILLAASCSLAYGLIQTLQATSPIGAGCSKVLGIAEGKFKV